MSHRTIACLLLVIAGACRGDGLVDPGAEDRYANRLPNRAPRASSLEFSDRIMTEGSSLIMLDAHALFEDPGDPLTLTATSSDPLIAVAIIRVPYNHQLTIYAVSTGVATVSVTATEPPPPPGVPPAYAQYHTQGLSVTRTITVTVIPR